MQSESEDPFLKWKYFIEGFLSLDLYNKKDHVGDFTRQDRLALQGLLQSSWPPDLKCYLGYPPHPSASSSQHISSVPIKGVKSPMVLRPQWQHFHSWLRNLNWPLLVRARTRTQASAPDIKQFFLQSLAVGVNVCECGRWGCLEMRQ